MVNDGHRRPWEGFFQGREGAWSGSVQLIASTRLSGASRQEGRRASGKGECMRGRKMRACQQRNPAGNLAAPSRYRA